MVQICFNVCPLNGSPNWSPSIWRLPRSWWKDWITRRLLPSQAATCVAKQAQLLRRLRHLQVSMGAKVRAVVREEGEVAGTMVNRVLVPRQRRHLSSSIFTPIKLSLWADGSSGWVCQIKMTFRKHGNESEWGFLNPHGNEPNFGF